MQDWQLIQARKSAKQIIDILELDLQHDTSELANGFVDFLLRSCTVERKEESPKHKVVAVMGFDGEKVHENIPLSFLSKDNLMPCIGSLSIKYVGGDAEQPENYKGSGMKFYKSLVNISSLVAAYNGTVQRQEELTVSIANHIQQLLDARLVQVTLFMRHIGNEIINKRAIGSHVTTNHVVQKSIRQ